MKTIELTDEERDQLLLALGYWLGRNLRERHRSKVDYGPFVRLANKLGCEYPVPEKKEDA